MKNCFSSMNSILINRGTVYNTNLLLCVTLSIIISQIGIKHAPAQLLRPSLLGYGGKSATGSAVMFGLPYQCSAALGGPTTATVADVRHQGALKQHRRTN